MKHHYDKGSAAIATREELEETIHNILEKDLHNITERDRWLLDLDVADCEDMSVRELQYTVFELEACQALGEATSARTDGSTRGFEQYCRMVGDKAPSKNNFTSDGSHNEERKRAREERDQAAKDATKNATREQRQRACLPKTGAHKRQMPQRAKNQRGTAGTRTQAKKQRLLDGLAFQNSIATRAAREGDDLKALERATIPRPEGRIITAVLKEGRHGEGAD